jgi:hypothetical protein
MKTRMLVMIYIFFVVMFLLTGSSATEKKIIPVDDAVKIFEGIYINTEYSGFSIRYPQKFVISTDKRIEERALATQADPSIRAEYKIVECWTDSKGNTYCTVAVKYYTGYRLQQLWKLDESGNTLEINSKYAVHGEYPTEIDPNPDSSLYYYKIYYRQ